MNRQTLIGSVLPAILVILILLGVCGFIAYFTNGFTSDFETFYLEADDKKIPSETSGITIQRGSEKTFHVKYTFSSPHSEARGYSVAVVPHTTQDTDFDFTVDGETYSFGEIDDLTRAFTITKTEESFTIKGDFNMQSVLSKLYAGKEVVFQEDAVDYHADLFALEVYSYNKEAVVRIYFHLDTPVTDVVVTPEEIVLNPDNRG